MGRLCRVEPTLAGPNALGILVPPGRRTVLIVRPRAVSHDLVMLRGSRDGDPRNPFREWTQHQGAGAAKALLHALQEWAADREKGVVGAVASATGETYQVQAEVGLFTLIACPRLPGQPYWPAAFAQQAEAERLADVLRPILHPPGDAEQEVYFNTRHFEG
jgi:hypothetical protein